jgi:tetratricopeptide (TPR) repeat protein
MDKRQAIIESMVDQLEVMITSTPKEEVFPYYYFVLGQTYWMLNRNPDRGEEMLLMIRDEYGDKLPRIHTVLGSLYKNYGKYEQAEDELKLAISKTPNPIEPTGYLAELYLYNTGDLALAEGMLHKLLKLDYGGRMVPKASGFYKLGNLHQKKQEFDKAEMFYDSAIAMAPINYRYSYAKGKLYQATNRDSLAEVSYKNSLSKAKDPTVTQWIESGLFRFYLSIKKAGKADSLLAKIDNYINGHYYLAKHHLEEGDLLAFEQAIAAGSERYQDKGGLFYNNACLYSLAGKPKEAFVQLVHAFEKGYADYAHMQKDGDLEAIRGTPKFTALMKKYFPEQVGNDGKKE